MAAEFKPFGFEDGHFFGKMDGAAHPSSLQIWPSGSKT
jgi:hypothetical protein